ncbi:hypothetical protein QWY77_07345 [Thalassotalea ponticola]|uniref:hypothetical protein n=1 Tax=Thalassotalea ponticola TaxID=1523392 RepID=UPI0025B3454E|nr:hypothetical protein [Thalassotalea ponticola]MDN3652579.1 hypothetical protein [Thalassotalea ponticola]
MKNSCPYCAHQLSRKEIFSSSFITCKACENKSYPGSFLQWVSIAILNFGTLFLLLLATVSIEDQLIRNTVVISVTLVSFWMSIFIIVSPVKLNTDKPID